MPSLRTFLFTLLLILAAGVEAWSQDLARRYYIQSRPGAVVTHDELVKNVKAIAVVIDPPDNRTGILADLDFPEFGYSAVSIRLTPDQVNQLDRNRYLVREDVALLPTGTPAGPGWPQNQFCKMTDTANCHGAAPVVYLLDTGIDAFHPDLLNSTALSFLPGLSYGYNLAITPPVLLDPYHDSYDHGTRMAGCLGGQTTGLLGAIGGTAKVKSVVIYDAPVAGPVSTFVSQAISGILGAVADHQARRSEPYLKNHASILLFAHSTTLAAGRFGDLDRAMEIAWESGLHVVMSAGNEGVPAVQISPAGAAWGYEVGGVQTRYWFGAPPAGATFYRGLEAFTVAGAYQQNPDGSLQIWPSSNGNISGADVIDGHLAGARIPCPQGAPPGGISHGSGTSYSAAFACALTASAVCQRPWCPPAEARQWIRDGRVPMPGGQRLQSPALPAAFLSYGSWIHHYYPPSPALSLSGEDLPESDPDMDGVVNFIEYYCGLDPRVDDARYKPELTVSWQDPDAVLELQLPRACWQEKEARVSWHLERSVDLLDWIPVAPDSFLPETHTLPCDGQPWRARKRITLAGGQEYYRLKFTAKPPLL